MPMRANVSTFAMPGKSEAAVAIAVGLREPVSTDSGGSIQEKVSVLTQAFSAKGDKRGSPQVTTAELVLLPNDRAEAKYEVLTLLKLKPGSYQLRMSATSRAYGKSGSVYCDLFIPDYEKEPLSISSVVVTASPSLVAGPKESLATILPVVPTTQREFQRGRHRGYAFVRVYQGGKASIAGAEMTLQLLDR